MDDSPVSPTRPPPSPPMSPHSLPAHARVSAFSVVTPHAKASPGKGRSRAPWPPQFYFKFIILIVVISTGIVFASPILSLWVCYFIIIIIVAIAMAIILFAFSSPPLLSCCVVCLCYHYCNCYYYCYCQHHWHHHRLLSIVCVNKTNVLWTGERKKRGRGEREKCRKGGV